MKKYILPLLLSPLVSFASTTSLNIYTNQSFINQTISLKKSGDITLKVPSYSNLADIRFELIETCQISNPELSKTLELETKNSLHVKNLLDEKSKVSSQIKALMAKEELLKTLSLKSEFDVKKIERISSFLTLNLIKNQNEIDLLDKKLQEIEKNLQEISPVKKEYKILHVNYQCTTNENKINVIYPQNEITFQPFYELYANDKAKNIDLLYKAKISQNGLEDLNNIDINIFSYAFNQEVNPYTFYPKYIYKKPEITYKENAVAMAPRALMKSADGLQQINKIELQELGSKYVYSLKNVTLALEKELLLDIDAEKLPAEFTSYIDGYGTNKAYVEAKFSTKKEYQSAPIKLFLNSMPIAQNTIPAIKKDTPTRLYLGANQFLHVKKELIKTDSENTFFGSSEIDTQKWRYTLTNKAKNSLHVRFVQRVPVSKDGDVKVKTIAEPLYSSQNAEGKTSWDFELKPDAKKEIIFGYEITRNK